MDKKKIFIIILIIYLIITFVSEILYRNKLYDKSIDYIEEIKQKGFFHYFYFFWAVIFFYGLLVIGFFISFLFYPIYYCYCFISVELFSIFIYCLLKPIYCSPRPIWDIYLKNQGNSDDKIFPKPTDCDGEFGNPSGHSVLCAILLILWHQFINSNYCKKLEQKKLIIMKIISLILIIVCIIFVNYSRINRQIHSFNQILFGFILGIPIFFAFCYILELNIINSDEYMEKIEKYKFIIIPIYLILFAISLILGLTRHNKNEDEYRRILKIYCDSSDEDLFGKATASLSCIIFVSIGGYIGLLFLNNKINKNHSNQKEIFFNWNKRDKLSTLKVSLFTLLSILIVVINILIPIKQYILKLIISIICYFLFGFLFYGVCFYYGCKIFIQEKNDELNKQNLLKNSYEIEINGD